VLDGDIAKRAAFATRCRHGFAYLPQGLGKNLYPTLSVFENYRFSSAGFLVNQKKNAPRE